jgi:hypothetical protein
VQDLFETAQMAKDKAEAAVEDAAAAVTAAEGASGKLGVLAVMGNSMMAQKNAQLVLDNRDKAETAHQTAEKALNDLMHAKTDADEHDNAQLDSAIADAIKIAEGAVEATKGNAKGGALKMAVEKVTGSDPKAEGYPKTSVQVGADVAMQIEKALMPRSSTDGAGLRAMFPPDLDATSPRPEDRVKMNDRLGMTWREIVGSDHVMSKRITSADNQTRTVEAASLAGMAADSASSSMAPSSGVDDGKEFDDASYKGIAGTSFCAGTDCSVDSDGNLVGSWYFTPDNKDEYYVKTAADGMKYEAETLFAEFGHWLVQNDEGTETTINFYASTDANKIGLVTDVNDTLTDSSATYTGTAAGMSLHKELDGDGVVVSGTLHSGAFTADVKLMATWGADDPRLEGTIDNFKSDNPGAVDPDWSVTLRNASFAGGTVQSGVGRTTSTGPDGEWQAESYGVDGARPTGIFGGFNAHFSDGHAAGAYATRKQ